ncbi:MAG TPA: tRNA-uridine aminocarboxypropyltransferase [Polyangiaceae bacterium]|nr:tRNA-uridine aminocarboxypropyltransferase [Polyangiaceae bacterium]
MSRRSNTSLRCRRCRMHGSLCICELIPALATRTRLVLVIHRVELRKPTNTGRLAADCLTNSEIVVRGHEDSPTPPFVASSTSRPVFLFPHADALPLDRFARSEAPVTLIVPDGTWRQAAKVRNRVPGFRDLPCVSLPPEEPSIYRLRSEAHEHGLATIEAIARAMGILEGVAVRREIERIFRAMVERTLWARGELESEEVTGGVPAGAMRHDPSSGALGELHARDRLGER